MLKRVGKLFLHSLLVFGMVFIEPIDGDFEDSFFLITLEKTKLGYRTSSFIDIYNG